MVGQQIDQHLGNLKESIQQESQINVKNEIDDIISDLKKLKQTFQNIPQQEMNCSLLFRSKQIQFAGWHYILNFGQQIDKTDKYEIEDAALIIKQASEMIKFKPNTLDILQTFEKPIKNLAEFLDYLIGQLQSQSQNNSEFIYKLVKTWQKLREETIIKGIGCCSLCPFCTRKCTLKANHNEEQHKCQQSHFCPAFIGKTYYKTQKPSMISCELMDLYRFDIILNDETRVTWDQFKGMHTDWDFTSDSASSSIQIEDFKELWKILGKELCTFYNMNFDETDWEQKTNLK